jgi:hypothetical protein
VVLRESIKARLSVAAIFAVSSYVKPIFITSPTALNLVTWMILPSHRSPVKAMPLKIVAEACPEKDNCKARKRIPRRVAAKK